MSPGNPRRSLISILALVFVLSFLVSCATGPKAPERGTPAYYWSAANETFPIGDYVKTSDHLEQLVRTENEYIARAEPWLLVLSAGMAKGDMEIADAFEQGARANRANPSPFRRQVSIYRALANRRVLLFAGTYANFLKRNKDPEITLAFPYPTGSSVPVPTVTRTGAGILPPEAEIETSHQRAIERAVLLSACYAVGAEEDVAKAQQMFKSGSPKVPRAVFMAAMAEALYDQSQLYVSQKLDQPVRLKALANHALEALKSVPPNKKTRDLEKKIQAALKKVR